MKNKKLNLDSIKVKSFVTSFDKEKGNTVKGGQNSDANTCPPVACEPVLSLGYNCYYRY
ncbi:MAG: pinensin family lanthipeptide [Bacteroidota bacterium]